MGVQKRRLRLLHVFTAANGMAESNAVSQYPEPPHFYKLYKDGPQAGPLPPPCVEGEFPIFGVPFNLDEPLVPPLEVGALFKPQGDGTVDAKAELLRLNQLLLVLFIELLSVLVEQPGSYAETLTRVIGALQNMQHLINDLRPQQARHTLEYILQQQIAKKREALAGLKQQVQQIRQQLTGTMEQLAKVGGDAAESVPKAAAGGAEAVGRDGQPDGVSAGIGFAAMDTS